MMERQSNNTRIGSPADFFFDDNFDSILGIQPSNGLSSNVPQLDVGFSVHQGHHHINGGLQPNDSIMRNAQSLSQLLSADSTTSRVHVTDTISMAVGPNSSVNAQTAGYNNVRQPYGGPLTNTNESFVRDLAALNRTSLAPMQSNNAMSSPLNGQHRFNIGGQQANGVVPLHLQVQNNMPLGAGPSLVNGLANAANMQQSLRHSVPLNGNLPPSAPGMLSANHMQQMPQQLHNNQLAAQLNVSPHGQPPTSDPEKRKLIQQQLVLLLHAHKCQRKQNGAKTCSLPHCQTMKNVLHHMTTCIAGKNCTVPHCSSSRQIIVHWKNCNRQECPVCYPLRNASDRRNMMGQSNLTQGESDVQPTKEVMAKAYEALGMGRPGSDQVTPGMAAIMSPPSVFSGPPSVASTNGDMADAALRNAARSGLLGSMSLTPLSVGSNSDGGLAFAGSDLITPAPAKMTKEWHMKITNDLRNHLVHKLVQAIFPTSDPAALRDTRMQNLIQYARRVEGEMFESAESQESYYHLLAEKIYKIQKELDEKQQRKRLEAQTAAAAAGSGASHNLSPGAQRPPLMNGHMGHASSAIRSLDAALGVEGASAPPSVDFGRLRSPDMASSPAGSDLSQLPSSTLFRAKQQLDILQHKQQNAERPNSLPGVVPNVGSTLLSPMHHSLSSLPLATGKPGLTTPPLLSEELRQMRGTHGDGDGHTADFKSAAVNGKASVFGSLDEKPIVSEREAIDIAVQRGKDVWRATEGGETSSIKTEIKHENVDFDSELTGLASVKTEEKSSADSDKKMEDNSATISNNGDAAAAVKLECKNPPGKRVWTTEELCASLLPTWEQMYKQEPEAGPFREPVDAVALNLVDYYDIIKRPMDLSTIRRKLEEGEYKDPWAYIDDVWLMFDNAWLFNRKMTKVYKFCSKLAEVFDEVIDPVMVSLGYCCGKRFVFDPQALCCIGKQLCTIPRDATYFSYEDKYVYCEKCFQDFKTDEIEVCEDPTQPPLKLKKDQFNKCKNNLIEPEGFAHCSECGRKMHQICVLHMKEIWPRFTCDNCLRASGEKRRDNKYTAKRLPSTRLGSYLENRVNNFLKKKDCGAGEVTIRVLNTADKVVEVKPGIRRRFANELPASFPYRSKAMFAFEEVDGVDICFFGMHVQEYGSDVAPPNTRRVYIAYLDSVHFFQPKDFRTAVYHEILVGYLDYVKGLGYNLAHIWACPPSEGDDYIFHCHPPEQKIPKPKRLQDWYRKMLDKATMEGVVFEYKDVLKDAVDNNVQSVAEMPYFEGDFWPNVIEESIKELDQEEKRLREEAEAAATEVDDFDTDSADMPESTNGKKKGQKGGSVKRKNKSAVRKNNKRSGLPNNGCDLNSKIFATMDKHKEVFFVIRLNPPMTVLPDIVDPDPVIHCDLMDGRDTFLTMAREKHHEFSSLRRVKFSSMALLYELHVQNSNLSYTCNVCRNPMETRWHCSTCEDYDLCVSCYAKTKHEHSMDKIDLGLDEEKPSADPREAKRQSLQRFIQFLEHACQCRDANCRMPSCRKMKNIMAHKKTCRRSACQMCNQVNNLLLVHARDCKETKCLVPFCQQIQQKLKQREQQQRVRNEKLMRRRMQLMHTLNTPHTPLSNSGAGGGGSSSREGGNGKGSDIGYYSPSPLPFSASSKPQQQPVSSKALEAAQQAQLMAQMSSSAGKFGAAQRMSAMGGPRPAMMDMQQSPLHPQQQQPMASSPMAGGSRWQSPIGQQPSAMAGHMADAQQQQQQQQMAMRMGSPFGPQGAGGGGMGVQQQQQVPAVNNPEMQKVMQMMRNSGQEEVAQKLRENPELLATFIKMRHVNESSGPRQMLPSNNGSVPLPQQQFGGMMQQMNSAVGGVQQQAQDRMGAGFHQQQQAQLAANNMLGHSQGTPMSQQDGQGLIGQGQGQGPMQHFPGVMPGQQAGDAMPMQQHQQVGGMAQFNHHQQQQQQQAQWLRQQQQQQQQMRHQMMGGPGGGASGQPPPYGMNQPMARMMVMSSGAADHGPQQGGVGGGASNMQFMQPQQQQMFLQQQQHVTQMRMMGVHAQQGGGGAMNAMMMQQSAMNVGVGAGPMAMQLQQMRASSQQQQLIGMRPQGQGPQRMAMNAMIGGGGGGQAAMMSSQAQHHHLHGMGGMGSMAGGPHMGGLGGLPGDGMDPQQQQAMGGMQQRLVDLNSFGSEEFF